MRAPLDETQRYFTKDLRIIVPLTVKDRERMDLPRIGQTQPHITRTDIYRRTQKWRS